MKIRVGFVSNSSSSSFCILGTYDSEVLAKFKELERDDIFEHYCGEDDGDVVGICYSILEDKTLKEAREYFVNVYVS